VIGPRPLSSRCTGPFARESVRDAEFEVAVGPTDDQDPRRLRPGGRPRCASWCVEARVTAGPGP